MSNSSFRLERYHELILQRTGLLFAKRSLEQLKRSIGLFSKQEGCKDPDVLLSRLAQQTTDSELWDRFIAILTVGETYFFRDNAQFDALRQAILPELIQRHRPDKRLRIWSAGCSSGEEPYSLAIMLRQIIPDISSWSINILATDINKEALRKAALAQYKKWSFRRCDPSLRERYFVPRGERFELRPEIRSMVNFSYLNLAEDNFPSLVNNTCALDLILCRNVAIYLPEAVINKMVERFSRCLLPGGWLLVAATETAPLGFSKFATRNIKGCTAYQLADPHDPSLLPRAPDARSGRKKPAEKKRRPAARSGGIGGAAAKPAVKGPGEDPLASARKLMEQGRLDQARHFLEISRAPRPSVAGLWYRGACYFADHGDLAQARYWAERATAADPLLMEAHYTLALILQEEGELREARGQLIKALYLNPNHLAARFSMAILCNRLGLGDEAARHRRHAIKLSADLPPDETVPGTGGLSVARMITLLNMATQLVSEQIRGSAA